MIGEVTFQVITHTLVIQFRDTFFKHFNLDQFSVATRGKCKIVAHVVHIRLDYI
jgi:hypothetical protein